MHSRARGPVLGLATHAAHAWSRGALQTMHWHVLMSAGCALMQSRHLAMPALLAEPCSRQLAQVAGSVTLVTHA